MVSETNLLDSNLLSNRSRASRDCLSVLSILSMTLYKEGQTQGWRARGPQALGDKIVTSPSAWTPVGRCPPTASSPERAAGLEDSVTAEAGPQVCAETSRGCLLSRQGCSPHNQLDVPSKGGTIQSLDLLLLPGSTFMAAKPQGLWRRGGQAAAPALTLLLPSARCG